MIKTIVSTELPVDEQFRIRKNVIQNGKEGLRFCVVTGTHGDELEGQMVCYELARIVGEHPDLLCGTLEIYPALNPLGIDTIQRGIPNFDLDMNRIFPGDPQGTMAEWVTPHPESPGRPASAADRPKASGQAEPPARGLPAGLLLWGRTHRLCSPALQAPGQHHGLVHHRG